MVINTRVDLRVYRGKPRRHISMNFSSKFCCFITCSKCGERLMCLCEIAQLTKC